MNSSISERIAIIFVPFLLGLFLISTTGFDMLPGLGVFNGKRVLEVFTLLFLLIAVLISHDLRTSFRELQSILPRWAFMALAMAFVLGTASTLRFSHPGYGLLEIAMLLLLILCTIATAAARRLSGNYFDRLALLIVITVGAIVAVTEFMGFLAAWLAGNEFSYDQMLVRFAHPRFYNQLQTFSIPLIAALPFVFNARKGLKVLAVILIGVQWCLVVISGGRGSTISLITTLVAAAFLFPVRRRSWMSIHLAGLIMGLMIYLGLVFANQLFVPGTGKFIEESVGRPLITSTGRVQMWEMAWKEALEQPALGSGPAGFACNSPPATPSHPHNFPMKLLAEWGFPAFLLIMAVCTWLGWCLIMKCRGEQSGEESSDILVAMLGCSILAATIHACVSGVLIMPASQVMGVLACGWAFGRLNPVVRNTPSLALSSISVLPVGIVVAALVCVFSISEVQKLGIRTNKVEFQKISMPRYWDSGRSCKYFHENR